MDEVAVAGNVSEWVYVLTIAEPQKAAIAEPHSAVSKAG
jgi:hypothetical protein